MARWERSGGRTAGGGAGEGGGGGGVRDDSFMTMATCDEDSFDLE